MEAETQQQSAQFMRPAGVDPPARLSTFIEERRTGIGGSDAAAILGESPYKTPLAVWMSKTGRVEERPDSPMLRRGRKLEAVVVSEYEEETKRTTSLVPFARHKDFPHMIVHADRVVSDPNREAPGLLEAKSANVFRLSEWEDEAPLHAQIQCLHGMIVMGLPWGSVAGLLGGLEFRFQDIDRSAHEDLVASIIDAEAAFWKLVETDTPPEPTAKDAKALNLLYRAVDGQLAQLGSEFIVVDEQLVAWSVELSRLNGRVREIKELKEEAENKMRAAARTAARAILPNGATYSLKTIKNPGYTVEPFEYRPVRRLKS